MSNCRGAIPKSQTTALNAPKRLARHFVLSILPPSSRRPVYRSKNLVLILSASSFAPVVVASVVAIYGVPPTSWACIGNDADSTLERLISEATTHNDRRIREAALNQIARKGTLAKAAATPLAKDLLHSPDESAGLVFETLRQIGPDSAAALRRVFKDAAEREKCGYLLTLSRVANLGSPELQLVVDDALRDRSFDVKHCAIARLHSSLQTAKSKAHTESVIAHLLQFGKDAKNDPHLRTSAARGLFDAGSDVGEGVTFFDHLLRDRTNPLKLRACGAHGLVSRSKSSHSIAAILRSVVTNPMEEKRLRLEVAEALQLMSVDQLKSCEVAEIVKMTLKTDDDPDALDAIVLYTRMPVLTKEDSPVMLEVIRWKDGLMATRVLECFARIGPPARDSVPELLVACANVRHLSRSEAELAAMVKSILPRGEAIKALNEVRPQSELIQRTIALLKHDK